MGSYAVTGSSVFARFLRIGNSCGGEGICNGAFVYHRWFEIVELKDQARFFLDPGEPGSDTMPCREKRPLANRVTRGVRVSRGAKGQPV